MSEWLLVALGAALGGPARMFLDLWIQERFGPNRAGRIPLGILVINILGSAALGAVLGGTTGQGWHAVLGIGFCGAFTTYSTFAAQTDRSWRDGHPGVALANVAANVALCTAAFWLTYTLI